jgi:hypothetical protein
VSEIYFDTETFLIAPQIQSPPLVCIQYCVDDGKPEVIHHRDPACRRFIEWMLTSGALVSGHNLSFDSCVLCANYPDLIPAVFDAYRADHMTCTETRQRLLHIAEGTFKRFDKTKGAYALDGVARFLGVEVELDKTSPWRLRYGELYTTDVAAWPADALTYAANDALGQRAVHRAQDAYAANKGLPLVDQFRQSYASFWLGLISAWGLRTDQEQVERYILKVKEGLDQDKAIIEAAGLLKRGDVKDTKKAKAIMEECCKALELEPPRTKGGGIALDRDSIDQFGNELLTSYASYGSADTLTSRVEKLRYTRINPGFKVLVDTGRISCVGAGKPKPGSTISAHRDQVTNPPRMEGYRECYIPDPDHDMWSVDWTGIELRLWGQRCFEFFGFSAMKDMLNTGRDPYIEFAAPMAGVSVEEAYEMFAGKHGKDKQKWLKGFRSAAKPFVLGAPTGMGPGKIVLTARKQYGVTVTLEEAKRYLELWRRVFPEGPKYHDLGKRMTNSGKIARDSEGKEYRVCSYTYPRSGRMRSGLYFTALLNGMYQGGAADLFKDAGGRLAYEMYVDRASVLFGSRILVPLHDEFLGQSPSYKSAECATRVSEIMCQVGREWCPDLKDAFSAPPALMSRWRKNAEPTFKDGKLVCWEPQT